MSITFTGDVSSATKGIQAYAIDSGGPPPTVARSSVTEVLHPQDGSKLPSVLSPRDLNGTAGTGFPLGQWGPRI
jgi:hypothetical protein